MSTKIPDPPKTPEQRIEALHRQVMRVKLAIASNSPAQSWLSRAMENLEQAAFAVTFKMPEHPAGSPLEQTQQLPIMGKW